jgi:hypothetical protein
MYEHRQLLAKWIEVLLGLIAALLVVEAFLLRGTGAVWAIRGAFIIVFIVWWAISVLVTRVDANGISWAFAWGFPRGHIAFDRIERMERTTLNLAEIGSIGWHWTIWHGWVWNVGGLDAIEIWTQGGGRTTIGTDDPQGLFDAIERFRTGAAA